MTHDAIWYVFASIAKESWYHVVWEQLHVFPSSILHRSKCHVNDVLFKDEVWIFVDFVITNPTHGIFLAQVSSTQDFCSMKRNTNKRMKSLRSPWAGNQFFPLAIVVFYSIVYIKKLMISYNIGPPKCVPTPCDEWKIWKVPTLNPHHLL